MNFLLDLAICFGAGIAFMAVLALVSELVARAIGENDESF